MTNGFRDFFRRATRSEQEPDGRAPYPYQERFAQSDELPHLLQAPTGAGKTATAVLGWLWRLMHSGKPTPRRLVYCLPMRVLVEQSARETRCWVRNVGRDFAVKVLMGGVDADEWYLYPERPAIVIGTQDMLLSRALNRGYGASRFHWPIDFGLLNNDCLWIYDEPQLMGTGVATSAQLAGLRSSLETFGHCPSVWMSATFEPHWLDTIDFGGGGTTHPLTLTEEDYDPGFPLLRRMTASKVLRQLVTAPAKQEEEIARAVVENHITGTQTLVIVNTVERATKLYSLIKKDKRAPSDLLLAHSRFRPAEREILNDRLAGLPTDRIVVATQVVEAGVDMSARTLFTDLAPWASVVQRMGRCNRTGNDGPGRVFWIDLDIEKQSAPYEPEDMVTARNLLAKLAEEDVSPKSLNDFKQSEHIELEFAHKHVIRCRDVLDLFDTAPDLSGNDIDVQRFVRGDDNRLDVQFFWRPIPDAGPPRDEPAPQYRELCAVPVWKAADFLVSLAGTKRGHGYIWDHLAGRWVKVDPRALRPGQLILLPASAGGYSREYGWTPESKLTVEGVDITEPWLPEAVASDVNAAIGVPLSIAEHTNNVCEALRDILGSGDETQALGAVLTGWPDQLMNAACWHDVGKALPVAQMALYDPRAPDPARLLAKSGRKGRLDYAKHGRRQFRHELGSGLAVLQAHPDWPFAVAYLIAAHHGRVRLAIRALPGEDQPTDPLTLFALGVRGGDVLPEVDLSHGNMCPRIELDLSPMRMGGERSWTARALHLLAELGPFRLAYLEAILRAADVRASRKEALRA